MSWVIPSVSGDFPPLTQVNIVETLILLGEQETRRRYGLSPRRLGQLRVQCGVPRWIVCSVQCKVMLYIYRHGAATHWDLIQQYPDLHRQSLWLACQLLHQRGYLVRTPQPPPAKGRQRLLYRLSPLAQSVLAAWKMQNAVWLTPEFFHTLATATSGKDTTDEARI